MSFQPVPPEVHRLEHRVREKENQIIITVISKTTPTTATTKTIQVTWSPAPPPMGRLTKTESATPTSTTTWVLPRLLLCRRGCDGCTAYFDFQRTHRYFQTPSSGLRLPSRKESDARSVGYIVYIYIYILVVVKCCLMSSDVS